MIAVNEGDGLLVESGIEQKEQARAQCEFFCFGEELAQDGEESEAAKPTPKECDDVPRKWRVRNEADQEVV